MFKGIWRSIVRWWRSLLGESPSGVAAIANDLPLLSDPDYEYLFMQLLEGVAHGWQQPRVNKFFHRVKQRAPKSQWMAWLNGFGYRLVNSSAPNEELARKMIQLSELDCGDVTSLAGEFGHQLLGRIYGGGAGEEFWPELEANGLDELELASFAPEDAVVGSPPMVMDIPSISDQLMAITDSSPPPTPTAMKSGDLSLPPPTPTAMKSGDLSIEATAVQPLPIVLPVWEAAHPEVELDLESTYAQEDDSDLPLFGEVPPELRLAKKSKSVFAAVPQPAEVKPTAEFTPPVVPSAVGSPVAASVIPTPAVVASETAEQVIGIEEFAAMLQNDPSLVQEIAQQLDIDTTDPQVVLDAVINQMQQQIQDGN
jgi:hypothetical protein